MVDAYKAILWYQSQEDHHPLTCGKNSNHRKLVALIDSQGKAVGLKCEDCEYIQRNLPVIVITMYREYLAKGWLANHKKEIIYDLKNMISDIEDEHYTADLFFQYVENRVQKWRQLKKVDEM